jgi:hypothetical protein
MYAKCGSMEEALRVFNELPSWDIVTLNAMLQGYAQNGCGEEALKTFWPDVWKRMYSQMISLFILFCQLVVVEVWWMKAGAVILQCQTPFRVCLLWRLSVHRKVATKSPHELNSGWGLPIFLLLTTATCIEQLPLKVCYWIMYAMGLCNSLQSCGKIGNKD